MPTPVETTVSTADHSDTPHRPLRHPGPCPDLPLPASQPGAVCLLSARGLPVCPPAAADVYCDRRLPEEARTHEVALGECLGGALYVNDFVRLAREVCGIGIQAPMFMF